LALRRKVRRDQSVATHRAARAVDQFFEHSGGDVLRLGNPVEQAWRNVHAAQLHALNDLDHTLAIPVPGNSVRVDGIQWCESHTKRFRPTQ